MNTKLLNTLKRDRSINSQYATIARLDGRFAWEFLLMPNEMQWTQSASYQGANTSGRVPSLQYASTSGQSVSMTFPVMATKDYIITDYVLGLSSLLNPDPDVPPVLYWRWGQRQLSPCVMIQCDRTESAWAKDGQLIACKISLTLAEVPENQLLT